MPSEIYYATKYIYQRLSGDAQLTAIVGTRIYARRVKQGADYPYILYSWAGGDDSVTHNQVRVIVEPLFWCRVVSSLDGNTSSIPVSALSAHDRMDELLQTARRIAVSGIAGYSFNSWRVRAREFSEQPPANIAGEILHIGGGLQSAGF